MNYQELYSINQQIAQKNKNNPSVSRLTIDKVEKHKIYFKNKSNIPYDIVSILEGITISQPKGYITNFSLLKQEIEYHLKSLQKQHYKGELGEFDYDPMEFEITTPQKATNNAFGFNWQILHYIGKQEDGSKIHIPQGVKNCSFMFYANHNLKIAPSIPDSVVTSTAMFLYCSSLRKASQLPKNIKVCNGMFNGCSSLMETTEIPNGVINCEDMFNGCTALKYIHPIPKSVKNVDYMFEDCSQEIQDIGEFMADHRGMTLDKAKKALKM